MKTVAAHARVSSYASSAFRVRYRLSSAEENAGGGVFGKSRCSLSMVRSANGERYCAISAWKGFGEYKYTYMTTGSHRRHDGVAVPVTMELERVQAREARGDVLKNLGVHLGIVHFTLQLQRAKTWRSAPAEDSQKG